MGNRDAVSRSRGAHSGGCARGRLARRLSWLLPGLLVWAALPLLLPSAVRAEPADVDALVRSLDESYRDALDELYRWCRRNRLNQTADEVAAELVVVDVEHEDARRWLGFRRKNGEWVPPTKPKTRRNWNRSASQKYPEYRAALLAEPADDHWRACEHLQRIEEEAARRRVLQRATVRWPADARFREAAGETLQDGAWILLESQRSPAMERRLRRVGLKVLERAPLPTACKTPKVLRDLEFPGKGSCVCKGITVSSATSFSEAVTVARHCAAAADLFRLVLDMETTLPRNYTVALGRNKRDLHAMVTQLRLPEALDKQRRRNAGFYVAKLRLDFNSDRSAAYRLECSVRRVIYILMNSAFGRFGRLGWTGEGLIAYMTWLVCRTHLVHYVRVGAQTEQSRKDGGAGRPDFAWLGAARRLAAKDELPELTYIVSVDLNAMTGEDAIGAYAFGVYLLAAQTELITKFLHATSSGRETARASEVVLGYTLPELDVRFRRWLRETE